MDATRFDPTDLQTWAALWTAPLRQLFPAAFRYETLNPMVQEIAILATMHNMASLLQNPGTLKEAISAELATRAERLAQSK